MGDYGLKISSMGTSVLIQIDKDTLFSTKFNSLKINSSGFATISTNGSGNGTTTIAHNLGYAPAFITYRKCTTTFSFLGTNTYPNSYVPDPGVYNLYAGTEQTQLSSYSDGTNINFVASSAQASTSYIFKYYTFVDLAENYTGTANPNLTSDYGWKVSKPGVDVKTAKEYQLQYSTRYKSLQYYAVNYKTGTLTLPEMWASVIDNPVQEATYIDIEHGLGYPPMFLAFANGTTINNGTQSTMIPFAGVGGIDNYDYGFWSFCDSTRVRIAFWRSSLLFINNQPLEKWGNETITIKTYIFTEDLSG